MIVYAIKNKKRQLLDCEDCICINSYTITLFKTKKGAKRYLDLCGQSGLKIVKVKIEEVEE